MTTLEIEFKTLLTAEAYQNLLPLFDMPAIHQTNHYLDTSNFALRNHNMALRVRTFEQSAELTLKVKQTIGNLEYNQPLSLSEASAILTHLTLPDGAAKSLLQEKELAVDQLQLLGALATTRYEKTVSFGLLALDISRYGTVTDYELEAEVLDSDTGKEAFIDFLNAHQIPYRPAKSKLARFCDALGLS